MDNKKYNLPTAIAMVMGIVIGSGVFFKAPSILEATDGNLGLSILAWIIGGLIMIVSAYTFSLVASNTKKSASLEDMANESVGRVHSYIISSYMGLLYYPILAGVVSWVCANFTSILFGITSITSIVILSFVYFFVVFIINILSPKIAGWFQISAATIKIIPLIVMGVVGSIYGLFFSDGLLIENFMSTPLFSNTSGFTGALCGTIFAYEGWICATSISKELKNPQKNLSRALIFGTIAILSIYLIYFIGLAGTATNDDFILNGDLQIKLSFTKILFNNQIFGTLLYVFVIISCMGTLNGVTMGATRNLKLIADTDNGFRPDVFKRSNKVGMNTLGALFGGLISLIYLIMWLLIVYVGMENEYFWGIDISELICILLYLLYIPVYISIIKKREDLNIFNRFIMPILAIISSIVVVISGYIAHGNGTILFSIFGGTILFLIMFGFKEEKKKRKK